MRIRAMALLFAALAGAATARANIITLSGPLSADQVVSDPSSISTGTGFGTVTIDTVQGTMTTDISWSGLTGPIDRSHVHAAPDGVSGPGLSADAFQHEVLDDPYRTVACDDSWAVITPCGPASGSLHDVLDLTSFFLSVCDICINNMDDFAATAIANGLYVDLHTQNFPEGEIRGQLLEQSVTVTPEPSTLIPLTLLGVFLVRKRVGKHIR